MLIRYCIEEKKFVQKHVSLVLVGQAYEVVEGVQELNLGPQQSSKSQVCLFILRKVNTKPVIVDFKTKFIE